MDQDDALLVRAAANRDRDAFAAIYRAHGDAVYEVCRAILRDRHEAQDAMQDAFVLAGAHIHQLRDATKLRPWLYAIARHLCIRRRKQLQRIVPDSDELVLMDMTAGPEEEIASAESVELVWDATAGLSERDRLVLELHLRRGLEGADLALALGTSASNAYVWLSRAKDQLEACVAVLLIARDPDRSCDGLAALLEGWDGELTPVLRKRLNRHVDRCEVCRPRRRRVAAVAMFGAAPALAAPIASYTAIADRLDLASAPPVPGWGPDGFPPADRYPDADGRAARRLPNWIRVAAIAGAAILVVLALLVLARPARDEVGISAGNEARFEVTGVPRTAPRTDERAPGTTIEGAPGTDPANDVSPPSGPDTGDPSSSSPTPRAGGPSSSAATDPAAAPPPTNPGAPGEIHIDQPAPSPSPPTAPTVVPAPSITQLVSEGDFCALVLRAKATDSLPIVEVSVTYAVVGGGAKGGEQTISMAPSGSGTYAAKLPPIEVGTTVHWRVVAINAGGQGKDQPVAGPDVGGLPCPP